jgi:hypothetical protein
MHPDRMPSLSLGIIVPAGAVYDSHHHWRTDTGALRASVRFEAGGYSYAHIQGDPAGLRELAAARVEAADNADPPAVRAAAVAEGWRADVVRQSRLPGLCKRLAQPLPLASAGRRRRWRAGGALL